MLSDPQILGMLIGVDGVERLVNNVSKLQIMQVQSSSITRGQVNYKLCYNFMTYLLNAQQSVHDGASVEFDYLTNILPDREHQLS